MAKFKADHPNPTTIPAKLSIATTKEPPINTIPQLIALTLAFPPLKAPPKMSLRIFSRSILLKINYYSNKSTNIELWSRVCS